MGVGNFFFEISVETYQTPNLSKFQLQGVSELGAASRSVPLADFPGLDSPETARLIFSEDLYHRDSGNLPPPSKIVEKFVDKMCKICRQGFSENHICRQKK